MAANPLPASTARNSPSTTTGDRSRQPRSLELSRVMFSLKVAHGETRPSQLAFVAAARCP